MIFTPFPNSSHKHSFQLCILFFYSFITFCEPVNTNFCFLQTLGHVVTHRTVVQLPGVISLKKMGSFCFLSATNCQFLAAKGMMSWLSPSSVDICLLSPPCEFAYAASLLIWEPSVPCSHSLSLAFEPPGFPLLCNFTLTSLINSVMNNSLWEHPYTHMDLIKIFHLH